MAVELIVELDGIDKKIKAIKKEITALVEDRGSLTPHIGSSDKPLPEPARTQPKPTLPKMS